MRFRFGLGCLLLIAGLAGFADSAFAVGSGAFVPHPTTPMFGPSGGVTVALADLNSDGRPDAVVAGAASTTIWLNDGSGNFSPHTGTPSIPAGGAVAVGDVNGDGRVDIVISGSVASVWLGTLTGFSSHGTFGAGGPVALGDLDGDGDLDAVLNGTVWLNNGAGTFSPHLTMPTFSGVTFTSVSLGNMDGDGDLDVVATGGVLIYVFVNDGSGRFTAHPMPTYGQTGPNQSLAHAVLGDLDGDGDLDVLAVRSFGGIASNFVYLNDGAGNLTIPGGFAGNTRAALADIDGDGDLDVLTDTTTGVWLNAGAAAFSAHPAPTDFGSSITSFALADIDNDGDLDVLVSHSAGATTVWLNRNASTITVTTSPPAGGTATCSPNPVVSGGSSTCTATANSGYTFTGWSGACSGPTCTLTNVTSPKAVTANFSLNTYTITTAANPSGGGTVFCTNNPVNHGGSSTCTATPSVGFAFVNWSGDCTGTNCVLTGVTSAKTVTANFTVITYTVMTAANPSSGGTVSCSPNPVPHGGSTTCTATANSGFFFANWSGDCTGATCTLSNVTSAKSVTAIFNAIDLSGPPRMGNISTRGLVLTGNDVMIGGFVIGGLANKTVAIVATGPSLSAFGISNPLANPMITLVRSSDQVTIGSNDDWQQASNAPQLQVSGFAPPHPSEAAILVSLPPGAYTAIVQGVGGGTGVAVIGVYEVDAPTIPLVNISTRGRVGTGNDVLIGGFVIQGSGPQTVAIVATGPSLSTFGIASPLANPTLSLVRSSDQAVIDTNDDWQSHANASQLQAAGFAPSNPLESGIYITLQPGAYTAILSGVGGATGVGVIGVYKVN